jgi:hypothetical protein
LQKRKDEKPERERPDHLDIDDDFDKTFEIAPRKDDVSRQKITSEKIIVSRRDKGEMDETEKSRYPKDLDIGRIVIEKTPEDEEILKRKVLRKEHDRPRSTEVTVTQHGVEEHPKTYVTEDTIKVGKLDVTHLEKEMVETKTLQERTKAYKDRVDGAHKVWLKTSLNTKQYNSNSKNGKHFEK